MREFSRGSGTNAASISDSIPVPRETVRRHLRWLERLEWVVKEGATYRIGPALLEEPPEELDALIGELLRVADLIRGYKRNRA